MPAAIPLAGAALGAIGASKQASAQKKAAQAAADAAKFTPYNVRGLFGSVNFDTSTNRVNVSPNADISNIYQSLGQLGQNLLGGQSPTSGFQDFASQLGTGMIPGLFSGALDTAGMLPTQAFGNQQAMMQQLSGLAGGSGAGLLNPQNADLAGLMTGQGMGAIQQALNTSVNFDPSMANSLLGQAQGMLGTSFDPTQMVNDRLSLLREQAAPQEERALNSLQQRLFSQGRLGSTGGSRDFEAFARGLGQADLARQVEAQNLGLAAQQQAANIGLNQAGALTGMAGLSANLGQIGANLDLAQMGQIGSIGQGLLGQAQGLQGLDLNRIGLGQGMLGLAGNLSNQGFGAAMDFNNLSNNRAQQRLQNAMSLFGFGNDMRTQDFNQALSSLQGMQSINADLRNLIALGGNIGGQQAAAGGNVAQALLTNNQSPMGGFFGGLGTSLMDAGLERYLKPGGGSSGGGG